MEYIILLGMACIFFAATVFLVVYNLVLCRKKVDAVYTNSMEIIVNARFLRLVSQYKPYFSYEYNGQKYHVTTGEFYTKLGIKLKFRKNKRYKVYINPNKPERMRMRSFIWYIAFSIGMMLIFLACFLERVNLHF